LRGVLALHNENKREQKNQRGQTAENPRTFRSGVTVPSGVWLFARRNFKFSIHVSSPLVFGGLGICGADRGLVSQAAMGSLSGTFAIGSSIGANGSLFDGGKLLT
jgi:hypothetical protein